MHIGDLLARLRAKITKHEAERKEISSLLSTLLHTTIHETDITVVGKELIVAVKPIIKNEMMLKKEKILTALKPFGFTNIR